MRINKVRIKEIANNYRLLIPTKIIKEFNINDVSERFIVTYENGNLRITKDENGDFKINDGSYLNFNRVFYDYLSLNYEYIETINDYEFLVVRNSSDKCKKGILKLNKGEMLLVEIRKLASQNVDLTQLNIKTTHPKLLSSGRTHFGSWRKAVESAGIKYPEREYRKGFVSPKLKYTKEVVMNELSKLHVEGVILTTSNVFKFNTSLYHAVSYYFDSWDDVLKELGINKINELKRSVKNLRKCGQIFEAIVDEIFLEIGIKFKKYNSKIKSANPDYIFNDYHWGDAKLSEWTINHSNTKTLSKYEKHCKLLTIIFFRGEENADYMITNKTRIISIYKIIKQLPKHKRKYFVKKLVNLNLIMSNLKEIDKFSKKTKGKLHKEIEDCLQKINIDDYKITKYRKTRTLQSEDVIKIKELLRNGFRVSDISRYFNVEISTIRSIRDNKIWKSVIYKSFLI